MSRTNVFKTQDQDKQVTLAGDFNVAMYKRSDCYVCMITVYFGTKLF